MSSRPGVGVSVGVGVAVAVEVGVSDGVRVGVGDGGGPQPAITQPMHSTPINQRQRPIRIPFAESLLHRLWSDFRQGIRVDQRRHHISRHPAGYIFSLHLQPESTFCIRIPAARG